jgi:hypothetical protein
MLKIHLGDTPNALMEEDFAVIAEKTDGYSMFLKISAIKEF